MFLASEPALGNRLVVLKVSALGGEEAEILGKLHHREHRARVLRPGGSGDTVNRHFACRIWGGQPSVMSWTTRMPRGTMPKRAGVILEAVEAMNQDTDFLDLPPPDRVLRTGSYVNAVIHLAAQLADALAHSQKCGIFHRDLKPSNVLIAPDGRPLLLDFNLSVEERFSVAKVGGTLPYMAPEELSLLVQKGGIASTSHYDPRSDLFSLGVILYQLLTGQLPFGPMPREGPFLELVQSLLDRQRTGPKPVREWNPQVDPRLAGLVERSLAVDPDRRPQTASQFAIALRKQRTLWRRLRRWIGCHRRRTAVFASLVAAVMLVITVVVVTRPPYSVREYRAGSAFASQKDYPHAIEHFSEALRANPGYCDAFVARGNAYQRSEKHQSAIADYDWASSLLPTVKVNGCVAYCLSRMRQHRQAVFFYQKALLIAGEISPAILNNLGFTYRQLAQVEEAEKYLRQAVSLDDNLQAAHHNLVLVFRDQAMQGHPIRPESFVHARRTVDIGPPSANLFRDVAEFYAVAERQDASLVPTTIEFVRQAVQYGVDPKAFRSNSIFSRLWQDKAFQEALATPLKLRHRPPSRMSSIPWTAKQA